MESIYDLERYRKLIFKAIKKKLRFHTPINTRQTITKGQLDYIESRCDLFEKGEIDKLL